MGRAMELGGFCHKSYFTYIPRVDPGSRHDYYTVSCLLHKFSYQLAAIISGRRLAGSKKNVTAQVYYVFKGAEGLGALVEGPVESDFHGTGGLYEAAHQGDVHPPLRSQGADYYPVDTQRLTQFYVAQHRPCFAF